MPNPNKVASDILKRCRDGKIFSVRLRKRTDGSVRDMVCRLGVKAEGSEEPRHWSPWDYDLMQVWDMEASGFRFINLPSVIRLRADGDEIRYDTNNHPKEAYA